MRSRCRPVLFIALFASLLCTRVQDAEALGQASYVSFTPTKGAFTLIERGHATSLYVDVSDYPGVKRAVSDLQADMERVSGISPLIREPIKSAIAHSIDLDIVLIGTISKSPTIDRLIREHKLDVSQIAGKWESTLVQVVDHPMPGIRRALVVAGSDKRGTIFGIYDLSEQIGVSPWYWWADVRVTHRDAVYVAAGRYVQLEPAVKYRGIFLNDEAPSLSGWTKANYGGYNHKFYTKVFELLLRLKANYLWPAMWGSAFNEDDPENARLADEYGIVMGTSHHEPMLRAQQEWKRHGKGPWDYSVNAQILDNFWSEGIERNKNFESTITLGMRGDGDLPMSEGANIALLEKIVATQRNILAAHSTPTLAANPKVWALYKEVQAYYEKGMRVPDDVTLLWCDDNWGNIRRLPTAEERKRSGGAGIYYHFDYVGDPRNYKWINTNPIPKVWEQMNLALSYGADRIWVVNVGDLKPLEFPTEYFLTLARDPQRWGKDKTNEFTKMWAEREFGAAHANEIAVLMTTYTRYNGRRKPELLDIDTFSLLNYAEADRVLADWKALATQAETLEKELPAEQKDSFYELLLFPIQASAIVNEMWITAGRNHLYAKQGRADANTLADRTRSLFEADAQLSDDYNHKLAHGKWNHMMDQTHIGYTYWQQPPLNVMPAVSEVQPATEATMGVAVEGSLNTAGEQHLSFDSMAQQTRFIDVFNKGGGTIDFEAKASVPWIVISAPSGSVSDETRILVQVDWAKMPMGNSDGQIEIAQRNGARVENKVTIHAFSPAELNRDSLNGFVESDGYIAMEAEHFSLATATGQAHWERIPDYGETLSGMEVFPVTSNSFYPRLDGPTLEYRMYLFDRGDLNLHVTLGPTLNFVPGRGLRFAVGFDDQPLKVADALEFNSDADWSKAVSDGVRQVDVKLRVSQPGYHTLRFSMVDAGLVLERLVVSAGPLKPSYLGPPESFRHTTAAE